MTPEHEFAPFVRILGKGRNGARSLDRNEAYVLCSLAADLKVAEVVDVPHVLVAMHISKEVLGVE